jgi:hypothetical protein
VDLSAVYEGPALVYFWRVYDRLRLVLDGAGGATEVSFVIGPVRRRQHEASMDLSNAVYGGPALERLWRG